MLYNIYTDVIIQRHVKWKIFYLFTTAERIQGFFMNIKYNKDIKWSLYRVALGTATWTCWAHTTHWSPGNWWKYYYQPPSTHPVESRTTCCCFLCLTRRRCSDYPTAYPPHILLPVSNNSPCHLSSISSASYSTRTRTGRVKGISNDDCEINLLTTLGSIFYLFMKLFILQNVILHRW